MPVAIILSAPSHSQDQFLTSRISRFYTEERPNALSTLDLGLHGQRAHGHRIAKLGRDIEYSIFTKISKPEFHSIEELIQKDSLHLVYYQEACRYWVKACLGLPRFKKNGVSSGASARENTWFSKARICRTRSMHPQFVIVLLAIQRPQRL